MLTLGISARVLLMRVDDHIEYRAQPHLSVSHECTYFASLLATCRDFVRIPADLRLDWRKYLAIFTIF